MGLVPQGKRFKARGIRTALPAPANLLLEDGSREKNLAWMYGLPNPVLPFIWFGVALPGSHPALVVERWESKKMQV